MDIFDAFPNAIETGKWQLCELIQNTEIGKTVGKKTGLDVIEDEVTNAYPGETPDADWIRSDTLLYVKPSQLPTLKSASLTSGYLCYNTEEDTYYEIREVGIGKNQETGQVEHVELRIRATEANYGI